MDGDNTGAQLRIVTDGDNTGVSPGIATDGDKTGVSPGIATDGDKMGASPGIVMKGDKTGDPLNIVMVGNDLSVRGGIAGVIRQITTHDWACANIHIEWIPTYIEAGRFRQMAFYLKALHGIHQTLRHSAPDLVHIHMSYRGSYLRKRMIVAQCRRYHVPYILHLHGSEFRIWYDTLPGWLQEDVRCMLRQAVAVIVMGERWRAEVRSMEPSARIQVICNAVAIPEYPGPLRMRWNAERFQVLFLGVLLRRKGVHDLVEAIRILRESGRLGKMHFIIAGSGDEEERLRALVREYGLEKDVDFAGWVQKAQKEALLQECQALVLPSYQEGLPVAVLEAIAHGLPVIASDVGDTASAVRDGESGWLIPPGNPEILAERLAQLSSDREQYGRMSANAARIAKEFFSEERLFRELEVCWRNSTERYLPQG